MAIQTKVTLKTYFQTGDIPTEPQYADLIDSMVNLSGDNVGSMGITGDITASGNISASGDVIATGTGSFGYVTANEISASGNIIGADLYVKNGDEGTIYFGAPLGSKIYTAHDSTDLFISTSDDFIVQADDIELRAHGGDVYFMTSATNKPIHFNVSTGNLILSGSGGLSSSGEIKGENIISQNVSSDEIFTGISNNGITQFQVNTSGISALGKILVPITASGHISGSSTTLITAQDLTLDRRLIANHEISGSSTTTLTIGGNATINDLTAAHITASGDISASGDLHCADLYLDNVVALQRAGGILNLGTNDEQTLIDARHDGLSINGSISTLTNVTMSGDLSGSSTSRITSQDTYTSRAIYLDNKGFAEYQTSRDLAIGYDNNIYSIRYGRANTEGHNFVGNVTASGHISGSSTSGLTIGGTATVGQINTGQGATEVYNMNQHVTTTSGPSFANLTITGNVGQDGTAYTWSDTVTAEGKTIVLSTTFPGVSAYRATEPQTVINDSVVATSVIIGSSNVDGVAIHISRVAAGTFKWFAMAGVEDISGVIGAKFSFVVL
jgi:hypothetical protein